MHPLPLTDRTRVTRLPALQTADRHALYATPEAALDVPPGVPIPPSVARR